MFGLSTGRFVCLSQALLWNCFGLYSLELGYQERFDNYSDFGSTEKPKFFLRWQPIDSSLTLRATFNEAYRAPTLGELFTSQVQIVRARVMRRG